MFLYRRRVDRTREKFQTHPRFDSQRVSRFSPRQNDPPLSLPDFCLNYPRFQPWKHDSRACNETLFLALGVLRTLPSISICKSLGGRRKKSISIPRIFVTMEWLLILLRYFISRFRSFLLSILLFYYIINVTYYVCEQEKICKKYL